MQYNTKMPFSAPQYHPPSSKNLDFLLIAGTLGILGVIVVVAVRANRSATPSDEACFPPLISEHECLSNCIGSCDTRYTTPDGLTCQECVPFVHGSSQICPGGTTGDLQYCASQCPNGLCMEQAFGEENATCYACYSCPEGLFASHDECEASCGDQTCAVRGQRGKLNCWGCQASCTDVCKEQGYDPNGTDYSEYVRQEIQDLRCVSDVLLQPNLMKVGDCICSKKPDLIVDERVPSCQDTVCGDVVCGETVTCNTSGDRQATVNCSWGGWKEIAPGLFQPVIAN